MREETDVCIIGGGLVGMLCALEVADKGLSVYLVDKNFASSGDHAASVLFSYKSSPGTANLTEASRKIWREISERFGNPIGLHENGVSFVALSQKQAESMGKDAAKADPEAFGFSADPEQIKKLLGVQNIKEEVRAVILEKNGGHIFAGLLHETLRQELIRKGVRVWGSDQVAELVMEDGTIKGIKTAYDQLAAENTVLCAGAWTGKLLAQIGLKLPLRPARSHRMELSVTGKMPPMPLLNRLAKGDIIIRPMRSGRVLVTYTGLMDQNQATWSKHVDHGTAQLVLKTAGNILPALAHAKPVNTQTNTLAVTPNGSPYIGRVAAVDGLFIATGMNADTFAYGPAVAKSLAALLNKEQPEIDLEAFSPDRYIHVHQQEDSFAEQEEIIRQTFKDLDPEALEKKLAEAQQTHEKAKAEARRIVEGKKLKENKQKVEYAKVSEEMKDE